MPWSEYIAWGLAGYLYLLGIHMALVTGITFKNYRPVALICFALAWPVVLPPIIFTVLRELMPLVQARRRLADLKRRLGL